MRQLLVFTGALLAIILAVASYLLLEQPAFLAFFPFYDVKRGQWPDMVSCTPRAGDQCPSSGTLCNDVMPLLRNIDGAIRDPEKEVLTQGGLWAVGVPREPDMMAIDDLLHPSILQELFGMSATSAEALRRQVSAQVPSSVSKEEAQLRWIAAAWTASLTMPFLSDASSALSFGTPCSTRTWHGALNRVAIGSTLCSRAPGASCQDKLPKFMASSASFLRGASLARIARTGHYERSLASYFVSSEAYPGSRKHRTSFVGRLPLAPYERTLAFCGQASLKADAKNYLQNTQKKDALWTNDVFLTTYVYRKASSRSLDRVLAEVQATGDDDVTCAQLDLPPNVPVNCLQISVLEGLRGQEDIARCVFAPLTLSASLQLKEPKAIPSDPRRLHLELRGKVQYANAQLQEDPQPMIVCVPAASREDCEGTEGEKHSRYITEPSKYAMLTIDSGQLQASTTSSQPCCLLGLPAGFD